MNVREIHIVIKSRLNKLDSSDYDNLLCYQINEAFNKAQLEWCRRQINGKNQSHQGSEQNKQTVSDLQILWVEKEVSGTNYKTYFETETLPKNILRFEKISATGKTKECSEGKFLKLDYIEESNTDTYLTDWGLTPSFTWAESYYTVLSNKVRVYHNSEFEVVNPKISYYRNPQPISIAGCENIFGKDLGDIDPEFNDDIVGILIDEAVTILTADMEHFNVHNTAKERKEFNT